MHVSVQIMQKLMSSTFRYLKPGGGDRGERNDEMDGLVGSLAHHGETRHTRNMPECSHLSQLQQVPLELSDNGKKK